MALKLYSASYDSQRGFGLFELLVSSFLGLLVLSLSLGVLESLRSSFKHDIARTKVNQNLRSALDIMGLNLRQAGEALPDFFPAVILTNGTSDELIIRRNLYENEILNVCQQLNSGTSNASILFAHNVVTPACAYNINLRPYKTVWDQHRISEGGTAKAFIYNRVSRRGEFFTYTGSSDTGTQMAINRAAGSWSNTYPSDGNSAAMYLVEEYKFMVQNNVLQIIRNEDTINALNVVDGISNFQVEVVMNDNSVMSAFGASDTWPDIQFLRISLTGKDKFGERQIENTVIANYFPRNVLSK
jgi:hypothetical protein